MRQLKITKQVTNRETASLDKAIVKAITNRGNSPPIAGIIRDISKRLNPEKRERRPAIRKAPANNAKTKIPKLGILTTPKGNRRITSPPSIPTENVKNLGFGKELSNKYLLITSLKASNVYPRRVTKSQVI